MSDDEEYNAETNYGIDDAYATSFKNRTDSDEGNHNKINLRAMVLEYRPVKTYGKSFFSYF